MTVTSVIHCSIWWRLAKCSNLAASNARQPVTRHSRHCRQRCRRFASSTSSLPLMSATMEQNVDSCLVVGPRRRGSWPSAGDRSTCGASPAGVCLTTLNGLALISLPSDNKSDGQRGVTLSGSALMENSGASAGGVGEYCVRRPTTIRSRSSGAAAHPTSWSTLVAPPDSSAPWICLDFYTCAATPI